MLNLRLGGTNRSKSRVARLMSLLDHKTIDRFWVKVDKNGPIMPGMSTRCHVWTAGKDLDGYGKFRIGKRKDGTLKTVKANVIAFEMRHGRRAEPCCMHVCNNRPCVRWEHLKEGTNAENMAYMATCGRAASGDRNGARLYPERLARGDRSGSRLHRDKRPRGDRHGFRLHPERAPHGERNGRAKITAEQVTDMRRRYAAGGVTLAELGAAHGVGTSQVSAIVRGKSWQRVRDQK